MSSLARFPTRFNRLVAAAALLLGTGAWAQPAAGLPPPAPDAGMQPAGRPLPPPPRGPRALRDAAATVNLDGTVARWLMNPDGDVDGLLLADGTQVAFAPHLSASVTAAVKLQDAVQLVGWREGTVFRAAEIRARASGRSVRDDGPPAAPPAPREPAALQALSATGRVETLLYGPRGEVNGVVLRGGELVRFPPHVGRVYEPLLRRGATLSARGYGTRNALGTVFEATAIGDSANSLRDVFAAPPVRPAS